MLFEETLRYQRDLSAHLGLGNVQHLHPDAADLAVYRRAPAVVHALPFARSARAEAVWASDACWNECGAHTAWALVGCLSRDTQGRCLTRADAGDRACQRACRIYGGPYWPID